MQLVRLFACGVFALVAASASAQETKTVEISGGWRFHRATIPTVYDGFDIRRPANYSRGWYADVLTNLSPKFAIVGDVGGTYFNKDMARVSGSFATNETLNVTLNAFSGGLRIRAPQMPALVPFGQILFGGEHNASQDERTTRFGNQTPSTYTSKSSASGAALILESGVVLSPGRIGVRAAAGYARYFGKADADVFRLSIGAVYGF